MSVFLFLATAADFPAFNDVYRECFPDFPPARSTVLSALLVNARIEIEAIAHKPVVVTG